MDMNRYNTRVIEAIRDEYKKCNRRLHEIEMEMENTLKELEKGQTTLTYIDYKNLEDKFVLLQKAYEQEKIRQTVWDKAREICINIADEEGREEQERLDIATKGMLDMFSEMFPGL